MTTDSGIVMHVQDIGRDSPPVALYRSDFDLMVHSWTRDGWILMEEGRGQMDIRSLRVDHPQDVKSVIATPANERNPHVSPDGKWLAYQSDESGADQVYVVSFPDVGRPQQVSTQGGRYPRWSPRGDELFYRGPDATLMAVPVKTGTAFTHGAPAALFKMPDESGWAWAPSPDGQRFLMARLTASASIGELHVVRNFAAVLRARGKP